MEVSIYIWPDETAWGRRKSATLEECFRPLKVELDQKAAIGAGASGLLPELGLLIVIGGVLKIAEGFLNSIGEDIWSYIKRGLLRAAKVKPKRQDVSVREHGRSNGYAELIWYLRFSNKEILVTIVFKEDGELKKALDSLPEAIDEVIRSGRDFGRIYWIGSKWSAL